MRHAGNGAFYHQCPRLGTSGLPSPTRGKGPEAAFLLRAASGFIAVLFVMRMSFLGYACDQWLALLDAMQPGDELYYFISAPEPRRVGRSGITLVRNGEIINTLVTRTRMTR